MKCKAISSFCGKVNMAMGEVRELPPPVADDLIRAGLVIPFEDKTEPKKKGGKKK